MNTASLLIAVTNGPVREGKSVGNNSKVLCRSALDAAFLTAYSAEFVIHCISPLLRPLFRSRFLPAPAVHV